MLTDINDGDRFGDLDDAGPKMITETGDSFSIDKRLNDGNVVVSNAYRNNFDNLDD